MNIVHIVYEIPLPHGSGGDLRNRAVHAALSELGPTNMVSVQALCLARKKNPLRKRSHIETAIPPSILREVAEHVAQRAPDLVVVDGVYLSEIVHRLVADGFRVAVNMHNIESALLQDLDRAAGSWLRRWRQKNRWNEATQADRKLARGVHGVWVCSDEDANLLRDVAGPDIQVDVIPNPLPAWCADAPAPPGRAPLPVRALFVAHLGWTPNIQAAHRFIDTLQPAIRSRFPDAVLMLCGRTPNRHLLAKTEHRSDITIVADPRDLTPYYADANVALIPLSEGGGTRLKVLEAMAVGVPVIATAKAVEGINIAPDLAYLLAETDDEFVTALARLAEEDGLRDRLVQAGRNFVFANHGPKVISAAVASAARAILTKS